MTDHALAELQSAHCYAAEFGTVLEWCAGRTDQLFTDEATAEAEASRFGDAMARAAVAYTQLREARRVERRFRLETAL